MPEENVKKISVTHLNIRQSIFFLLLKLVLLDVFAAFLSVIFFTFLSNSYIPLAVKTFVLSSGAFYFLLLIILKIALTLYVVLAWLNEYYEIRLDSIVHRSGIIWKKEYKYPLRQIRLIKTDQGLFGKFFNYGTINPYDWDLSKYAPMYLIHNPLKYQKVLENLIPRAGQEKETIREGFTEKE